MGLLLINMENFHSLVINHKVCFKESPQHCGLNSLKKIFPISIMTANIKVHCNSKYLYYLYSKISFALSARAITKITNFKKSHHHSN